MIIQEFKILSEGLWESVKTDLMFFSPIQLFVKNLSEMSFSELDDIQEAAIYLDKIDAFFEEYKSDPKIDSFYIPPRQISLNLDSIQKLQYLIKKLKSLDENMIKVQFEKAKLKPAKKTKGGGKIFIGHGRSKLWARLKLFIEHELLLQSLVFEDESRTSETIINILNEFLDKSSFAILIMTAEDETASGTTRARQNVIHEAGLFQGRLGFDNVIILKQNLIEEFTNIAGLQYIPFSDENIEQTFYELQRKLKKVGLIK